MKANFNDLVNQGVNMEAAVSVMGLVGEGHDALLLKPFTREAWMICPLLEPEYRNLFTDEETISKLVNGLEGFLESIRAHRFEKFLYVKADKDYINYIKEAEDVGILTACSKIEQNQRALVRSLDDCPLLRAWDVYAG